MNKILLILAGRMFLLAAPSGEAQAPATGEPKELETMRTRYQADLQFAAKPIQSRYVSQLQGLMKTLTQKGDLAGALVVMEELKKLDPQAAAALAPGAAAAPDAAAVAAPLASRIINSTWAWWGSQTITFQNGGKVRWSSGQTWTWKPGSDANTITGETAAKQPFTITINPDFKTGTIQGAVNGETHRIQK